MTAPNINIETITASLERSFQNCSLNHRSREGSSSRSGTVTIGSSSNSDDHIPNSDTALELNSHISLPYYWEQCLDLKTGEIYYINWRNGMKAKEDPRTTPDYSCDYYSEDGGSSSHDSGAESSSESSPCWSREGHYEQQPEEEEEVEHEIRQENQNVLVVAGCKSCFMYFMVPKEVQDCPKCTGQLLHFDRSENASL
ncbi:ATP-dependent RNA helicase [Quillaja saponaria]|uniref:ATP-dependent RNA helicase n=1 Tax=Quillaja saponaria TaxID=32244 RepID=A0AAD7P7V9_QUISA|nr:ATP-dependent RNA helicase [Quillaja saponaria]